MSADEEYDSENEWIVMRTQAEDKKKVAEKLYKEAKTLAKALNYDQCLIKLKEAYQVFADPKYKQRINDVKASLAPNFFLLFNCLLIESSGC